MTIEEAIKEMESLSPSETAINMTLQHLKFYKDGLEREIEKNRENVFEIIDKDHVIDAMAEEIFIKRAYSITCKADIQRLKEQIIEEYKNKVKNK